MINVILSTYVIFFLLIGNFILMQRKQIATLEKQVESLEKITAEIQKDHPVLINADLLFCKRATGH